MLYAALNAFIVRNSVIHTKRLSGKSVGSLCSGWYVFSLQSHINIKRNKIS